MTRLCIAWLVMLGLGHAAIAQPAGQVAPVTALFLEKRVPDELAVEGTVLSRQNLALQIEQMGERWLVSVVDLTTGRVAASTKLDVVPADREAAVAAMTHVVADLAAQVAGRSEPPPRPATAPAPPPPAPPAPDGVHEGQQRELAELRYRRESLRFGAKLTGQLHVVSAGRDWKVYRGDLDEEVEPEAFYRLVARADLIGAYQSRRSAKIASYVIATVGAAAMLGVLIYTFAKPSCSEQSAQPFNDCVDDRISASHLVPPLIAFGISFTGTIMASHYARNPQPIEENDAKALADAYNQRLRRQLGLPVVTARPVLHDLGLRPFAARTDAGLVLGARF